MNNQDNDCQDRAQINQFAIIWNYNAHVEHQYIYYGKKAKTTKQDFVPCELKFFNQELFGSEEKQLKLVELLKNVASRIDVTSGREWFAVYAGYRYFRNQLAQKGEYTDFFEDIEHLLPHTLTRLDKAKARTERYQKYTVLMGREVELWYMNEGKLPPIQELTTWKVKFKGDWNRYEKLCLIIADVYKSMKLP